MKTIRISKTDTEVRNRERTLQGEDFPIAFPTSVSAPPTKGSIYCMLYHRFLAHRILYRKRTNKNRSTPFNIGVRKGIGAWNSWNENAGWGWETESEKEKRELTQLGARESHASLSWDQ